ncbi:ZP domain-containing protein [Aphelenchoides besseyi]|nr:ZP domain-containing protein [Aphelenchoides besseyi]
MSCSTDLNIVAHPFYDTYHDVVRVHAHAFKLPDHTRLSIRCDFQVCTDIKDEHGKSSCQEIGTPPFCPDIVTSPHNSVLFDGRSNNVWRARAKRSMNSTSGTLIFKEQVYQQRVHADLCLGNQTDEFCGHKFEQLRSKHLSEFTKEEGSFNEVNFSITLLLSESTQMSYCVSRFFLAAGSGLSVWLLFISIGIHFYFYLRSTCPMESN